MAMGALIRAPARYRPIACSGLAPWFPPFGLWRMLRFSYLISF